MQLVSDFTVFDATQGKGYNQSEEEMLHIVCGIFYMCTKRGIPCTCLGISNKRHWLVHKNVYAAFHLLPID
jgi:hypothetical protein